MIPVARSLKGGVSEWIRRRVWKFRSYADLSRFCISSRSTIWSEPSSVQSASHSTDTIAKAVDAVRSVIE